MLTAPVATQLALCPQRSEGHPRPNPRTAPFLPPTRPTLTLTTPPPPTPRTTKTPAITRIAPRRVASDCSLRCAETLGLGCSCAGLRAWWVRAAGALWVPFWRLLMCWLAARAEGSAAATGVAQGEPPRRRGGGPPLTDHGSWVAFHHLRGTIAPCCYRVTTVVEQPFSRLRVGRMSFGRRCFVGSVRVGGCIRRRFGT